MSNDARTTLLELDDDPLGGIRLESQVAFGARAALLAGLTDSGEWWEIPYTLSCSGGFTFAPPEPDLT
jgi:hypothetical protein